ncbi:MAG: dihydrofolate reductase family protein [Solirubrobacteraceae bacterium]
MQFTRLLPDLATVAADEMVAAPQPPKASLQRPYTIANLIASADGRVAVQGRSGALSDPGDRAIFHALREQVDAVLAGTHTLAVESYGRIIKSAEARERRRAAGREAEPLACVISASGAIPLRIPLFAEPQARVVILSPTAPDLRTTRAQIDFVRTDPRADRPLTEALHTLRSQFGVQTLLCEGGPTLLRSLLAEELLDELFLTLAPMLTGGGGPTLVGPPPLPRLLALRLLWLLSRGDSLYLRYGIGAGADEVRLR